MTSIARRVGAMAGALVLAFSLTACSNASSNNSTSAQSATTCADDSADQSANVDRSGNGNFPAVSNEDTPVISAGSGEEPTDKVLVKVLRNGDGAEVCAGAHLRVNYVGALWDGTVFDSSYTRGQPAEFSLNQVVRGWAYGLAHTHVGDRVELVIPASLGYGAQANGQIPANSTLVFVVDILGQATNNVASDEILNGATPTGDALPAGITVSGDAGAEPTLTIDESQSAPTEMGVYTVLQGNGPALEDGQTFLYKAVQGGFGAGGQTRSSWAQDPLEGPVTQAQLAGYTVGSRIVIVQPIPAQEAQSGQAATDAQAAVLVVDIVGTQTTE